MKPVKLEAMMGYLRITERKNITVTALTEMGKLD